MAKFITILGKVLLIAGFATVAIGTALSVYIEVQTSGLWAGIAHLQMLLNPFNVINFIAVVATLAPGLLLLYLGEKLKKRE